MKRFTNPLYPAGEKDKITAACQQAAFMDDTDAAFKKKSESAVKSTPTVITTNRREARRTYDQRRREITNTYKAALKKLRYLKRAGEISSNEHRSRKRQLKRRANTAYSENFKQYILNQ